MDFWDELIECHNTDTNILKLPYYHPLTDDHHIYVQNNNSWYEYFWNKLQKMLHITY